MESSAANRAAWSASHEAGSGLACEARRVIERTRENLRRPVRRLGDVAGLAARLAGITDEGMSTQCAW